VKWDWTTVIAVISLFLSIINTSKQIYDWMLKRREEKEKQEEKKKAWIAVSLIKLPNSKGKLIEHLYLKNTGKSTAYNIDIKLIKDGEPYPLPFVDDSIPKMLAPDSESKMPAFITFDTPLPWRLRISWDDDYKKGNSYETEVS